MNEASLNGFSKPFHPFLLGQPSIHPHLRMDGTFHLNQVGDTTYRGNADLSIRLPFNSEHQM
jgi:hypothetical protein